MEMEESSNVRRVKPLRALKHKSGSNGSREHSNPKTTRSQKSAPWEKEFDKDTNSNDSADDRAEKHKQIEAFKKADILSICNMDKQSDSSSNYQD